MNKKNLYQALQSANTEEELKNFFAKFFKIKLNTKNKIDLYTPQVIFEFKFDSDLQKILSRAKIIAQALYYVRKLKYGNAAEVPSKYLCGVDKNSAILFETAAFKNYYQKSNRKNYDWDRAASNPCPKLVADLEKNSLIQNAQIYDFSQPESEKIFIERLQYLLSEQVQLIEVKKEINEDNFYEIFQYWQSLFGNYVENSHKSSEYFITDIEHGRSTLLEKSVLFRMSNGELIEKQIPIELYKNFWNIYEKIYNARTVVAIRQKMDRMSEIELRRFTGEFFTPINFAKKAVEYLERTVGANWYKSGKFRLWDMACGTGNLEFVLPSEALEYCYLSTLLDDDAKYCKKIYPEATVFQYDYLNDDVKFFTDSLFEKYSERKMPKKLVDDLKNPEIKWIIFINPPYATANNPERKNKISKDKVSMTEIRKLMMKDNLGNVSQELFAQFLYRINLEFKGLHTWLGMFSKIKYINSNNDQPLRDNFFNYKFERGFIFSSKNFDGCSGKFPVGFLIWNLFSRLPLNEQKISLDVYNNHLEKIAIKNIQSIRQNNFLNKWIKRPRNVKKFPPFKSALKVAYENKDRNDLVADGFLAGFMIKGNDFLNQNSTALLSGPYASHAGHSITEENFEQAMIIHMARRLPKATWLNDKDQFMQPTKELPREFIVDAVIWSLFSNSNNTAAMSNVEYEGKIYQIRNNFYPFKVAEVETWNCSDAEIREKIYLSAIRNDNRFVAEWISQQKLSAEAMAVLNAGKSIYKNFYEHLNQLDKVQFKISTYDVGWYQVRMSLNDKNFSTDEISVPMKVLGEKLLPQIYELGFLQDEVVTLD